MSWSSQKSVVEEELLHDLIELSRNHCIHRLGFRVTIFNITFWRFLYEEERRKKLLLIQWSLKVSIYVRKCAYMFNSFIEFLFYFSFFSFLAWHSLQDLSSSSSKRQNLGLLHSGASRIPNHWTGREFPYNCSLLWRRRKSSKNQGAFNKTWPVISKNNDGHEIQRN